MDELIAIVRELMKREPWDRSHVTHGLYCRHCMADYIHKREHFPDCPWLRAKNWLEEYDGDHWGSVETIDSFCGRGVRCDGNCRYCDPVEELDAKS